MTDSSAAAAVSKAVGANIRQNIPYEDLREWITEADRLGELRHVNGANWQEEIGMATELVSHDENGPAILFDEVPGVAKGFRVLANLFAGKRKNMTLGFPVELDKVELSAAFAEAYAEGNMIPPIFVDEGPIFENIITGKDIDVEMFPTPLWHELDGGR